MNVVSRPTGEISIQLFNAFRSKALVYSTHITKCIKFSRHIIHQSKAFFNVANAVPIQPRSRFNFPSKTILISLGNREGGRHFQFHSNNKNLIDFGFFSRFVPFSFKVWKVSNCRIVWFHSNDQSAVEVDAFWKWKWSKMARMHAAK